MGLELFWSEFAKSKLATIYQYYKLKAGKKVALKIISGIVDRTNDLNKNPEIGRVEDALDDEERKFRYLVHSNYKIIYYINIHTNRVVIANVFDTRQDPDRIKEMN